MANTKLRNLVAGAAIAGLALVALPSVPSVADEVVATDNLEHVTNLEYPITQYPLGDDFGFAATDRQGGTDLETFTANGSTFVAAGSYRNGLQLIDVTDPENPVIAQTYECGIAQGDIQVFERDGRTYVGYAQDDIASSALFTTKCFQEGFALYGINTPTTVNNARVINSSGGGIYGTFLIDVTDPYATTGPDRVRTVGWARYSTGAHNTTVSPDGMWLMSSNQDLIGKTPVNQGAYQIEVFSLADLTNPTLATTIPLNTGAGPHDITFSADGTRAYVAAVSHTVIVDMTNPVAPVVLGKIVDPAISIHHQSDPLDLGDRRYLIVSDELAGVIEGSVACPGGGLHIYDITGPLENAPVKVGAYFIPQVAPPGQHHARCTAHVFKAYPEQGIMTIVWYGAGVRVLDISGLVGVSAGVDPAVGSLGTGIREIASHYFTETESQIGSQTWSAKIHEFESDGSAYIFANDLDRGFDVYKWDGTDAVGDPGIFVNAATALQIATDRGIVAANARGDQALPYCVILKTETA